MYKILITTSSFNKNNFLEYNDFIKLGFEIFHNPFKRKMNQEEILSLIDDKVIAIIAGLEPLNKKVFLKATSLKLIVRCGIGLDNVDLITAQKLKIKVFNTPDGPTLSVAELTVAHILSLIRRISESDRLIRKGTPKKLMGNLLSGKTVGVFGLGRIGLNVIKLLLGFNTKVLAYDILHKKPIKGVNIVSKEKLLRESDIITLHIPYSKDNHHFINEKSFLLMKKKSFILNISREGLVDENALYNFLKNNKNSGAALDCFEEVSNFHSLLKLNNVQFTSHMGSYSKEGRDKQEKDSSKILVRELKKLGIYK